VPQPLQPRTGARRILVVDDDAIVLEGLRVALARDGFEVVLAKSGYAAIDALSKEHFDLVLTDLKMPGLSGIRVLECSRELSPETPVVVLSGYAKREAADEALAKGAREFLVKPVDHARLRETVVQLTVDGGRPGG
jgi:DNA-binding NtrC family response regulator